MLTAPRYPGATWRPLPQNGTAGIIVPTQCTRICSIEGCERVHYARGWCRLHHSRWQRQGDPMAIGKAGPKMRPLTQRLWRRVVLSTSGCWLYEGASNGNGYGVIGLGRATEGSDYVHRVSYRLFVGDIPPGYEIDHLCRVRNCINPAHLEAVTQAENKRRAMAIRYPTGGRK